MVSFLKQFFMDNGTAERIAPDNEPERIQIAVCALLLEAAHSDDEFTDDERQKITEALQKHFSLTEEEAVRMIAVSEEARQRSVGLWHFTSLLNEKYSLEERIAVAEMLWEIVYADAQLDAHEDYLMHQMGSLLHLEHKYLIAAKLKSKR